MKKIISFLLILSLYLLTGCSDLSATHVNSEAILNEYLKNVDNFEVPVRQYGEPIRHIDMTDEMVIGILYPETDNEFLNSLIKNWIKELEEYYKNELPEKTEKNYPSELNASYESFIINKSFVSIRMTGVFNSPTYVHPDDIIKTFNIDINKNKILTVNDFFTEDGIELFKNIFIEKTGIKKEDADEKIFDNFVLMENGIEIILERGSYLPMSDGTKTIFFAYEEIKDLMKYSLEVNTNALLSDFVSETDVVIKPEKEQAEAIKSQNKKYIALTFDDGPSVHTERLLDVFKKEGGKGTFFVVGNLIDRRPETLKRIYNEGHQIGNHGWDHKQLTTLDKENIKHQIMMTRAKIYDITGIDTPIMRPPYGSCNNTVKNIGEELGVSFVNWTIDTLDWKTKNADSIYNEIIKNAKDGSIILCHDIFKTTVDAIERAIPKLIQDGYEFVTVSELFEINNKQPAPGKVYFRF